MGPYCTLLVRKSKKKPFSHTHCNVKTSSLFKWEILPVGVVIESLQSLIYSFSEVQEDFSLVTCVTYCHLWVLFLSDLSKLEPTSGCKWRECEIVTGNRGLQKCWLNFMVIRLYHTWKHHLVVFVDRRTSDVFYLISFILYVWCSTHLLLKVAEAWRTPYIFGLAVRIIQHYHFLAIVFSSTIQKGKWITFCSSPHV